MFQRAPNGSTWGEMGPLFCGVMVVGAHFVCVCVCVCVGRETADAFQGGQGLQGIAVVVVFVIRKQRRIQH